MSDLPAPDDNSITARLSRIESRLAEQERRLEVLEFRAPRRLALPAPEKTNGAAHHKEA